MTQYARLYGGSLYDLAAEENLTDAIGEQMKEIRNLFRENPDYVKLLCEPSVPKTERTKLIEEAFGGQAERYLVNFMKLLCERNLLGEFAGCCEEFTRRYHADHGIAEAVVTSAVALSDAQLTALKAKLEKSAEKPWSWCRSWMLLWWQVCVWNWKESSLTERFRPECQEFPEN